MSRDPTQVQRVPADLRGSEGGGPRAATVGTRALGLGLRGPVFWGHVPLQAAQRRADQLWLITKINGRVHCYAPLSARPGAWVRPPTGSPSSPSLISHCSGQGPGAQSPPSKEGAVRKCQQVLVVTHGRHACPCLLGRNSERLSNLVNAAPVNILATEHSD